MDSKEGMVRHFILYQSAEIGYFPIASAFLAATLAEVLVRYLVADPAMRENAVWWDVVAEKILQLESVDIDQSHAAQASDDLRYPSVFR